MRSNAIRMAARGENCTFEIVGVCNHNPETVVLCHLPDESHGMGRKADDISAAFGCSACHDVIDRRVADTFEAIRPEVREQYMRRAQTRTMRRLIELGVVTIRGLK